MTLLAWIDYCRGNKSTAEQERKNRNDYVCCNNGGKCSPYTCTFFCDGFGMKCPDELCKVPYYVPDPSVEREEYADMIRRIGRPHYTQQQLFE